MYWLAAMMTANLWQIVSASPSHLGWISSRINLHTGHLYPVSHKLYWPLNIYSDNAICFVLPSTQLVLICIFFHFFPSSNSCTIFTSVQATQNLGQGLIRFRIILVHIHSVCKINDKYSLFRKGQSWNICFICIIILIFKRIWKSFLQYWMFFLQIY